jgi:hypothetical protein
MNQALYAHMNNKRKKKQNKKQSAAIALGQKCSQKSTELKVLALSKRPLKSLQR